MTVNVLNVYHALFPAQTWFKCVTLQNIGTNSLGCKKIPFKYQ